MLESRIHVIGKFDYWIDFGDHSAASSQEASAIACLSHILGIIFPYLQTLQLVHSIGLLSAIIA